MTMLRELLRRLRRPTRWEVVRHAMDLALSPEPAHREMGVALLRDLRRRRLTAIDARLVDLILRHEALS